ncbi:MAG TPA: rhomboid family intramembrane serine protease [Desulfobacterales bacterium]
MFIVPLTGKISWRRPPVVTIALILINSLILFLFYFSDMQRLVDAEQYYFDSGLAEIEVQAYVEYRGILDEDGQVPQAVEMNTGLLAEYREQMRRDESFMQDLRREAVIPPGDDRYEAWRQSKDEYESRLASVTTYRFGFRPARHAPLTFLAYMFLHGGFGHLLGNMIFLWIVGCILENACGRWRYLGIYLVGGVLAVVLYWAVYPQSDIPLVGASGSIAALMGAFTVIFGVRKVKFFYSLGVYFNYVRLPAIWLLPVWIGKEFFQLWFGSVAHVAYVAHIGGLVGGALLGFVVGRWMGVSRTTALQEPEPTDGRAPQIAEALEKIAALDLEGGRRLLRGVLQDDPDHRTALTHLFNVEKNLPDTAEFHQTASRLLGRLMADTGTWPKACEVYEEYVQTAGRPRLSAERFLRISTVFAAVGRIELSQRILSGLMRQNRMLPGIPTALMRLAEAYRKRGADEGWRRCLTVIVTRYPDSPEARQVETIFHPGAAKNRRPVPQQPVKLKKRAS